MNLMRLAETHPVANRVVWLISLLVLLPLPDWAQPLDSFERLALLINLDHHIQVQEQSGIAYAGRLTSLTRRDLVIETAAGEKRFTNDIVRAVAVRGHPLRTGALIGAASLAVLGSVAICAHKGGSDCELVGALGAAPIGAGIGLVIGSFVPQMRPVYRAPEDGPSAPLTPINPDESASLLEDLALRVNLNDRITVEDQSGNRTTGRLRDLTDDEITIHTAAGERHFTRTAHRQVGVRRHHFRTGTLIGAGTGTTYGALSECGGGAHADCPDGLIIGAALGAGAGLLVATLVNSATVAYPAHGKRTLVSPQLSGGAVAVMVTRLW